MVTFSRIGAVFAATLAVATPIWAEEPTLDTVLATVDSTEITLGHLLAAHDTLPDRFRSVPPEALFEPLIEQLIEQTIVMQFAQDSLTRADQIALENERRAFIADTFLTRAAEAALTDENINEAYAAFVTEFDGREPTPEFNASHIIVETEEEAAALLALLDDGADFAELAREHSMDGAAAGGGSLGWFGLGAMVPEFEQAVQTLEVGAYMGPLQTRFGWHLVILNDTRMSQAPALDEVRAALERNIRVEAAQQEVARISEKAVVSRAYLALDPSVMGQRSLLDD